MALSRITNPFLSSSGAGNASITSPSANTIAFSTTTSERMRIDSSGNVGVGTSSPFGKFDVFSGTNRHLGIAAAATLSSGSKIESLNDLGTTNVGMEFRASDWAWISTGTERMRIDSSGNVGIGTSSPNKKLEVLSAGEIIRATSSTGANDQLISVKNNSGTADTSTNIFFADRYAASSYASSYIRGTASGTSALIFATGGTNFTNIYDAGAPTERMRIDSSGNLLVGVTGQYGTEKFGIGGTGTNVAWIQQVTNTSGYSTIRSGLGSNGNNTSSFHFHGNTNTVGNWYLYGNGTTSFTSDERLKKNIETTRDGYVDDLCRLRVVKYNWKKDDDGTPKELGLIAQEVEQVFPNLVQDDINPVSENDETVYKQVKQSVLPFMLLKAIQEQQSIIAALTSRIEALESK
jgi:hypothetical protein